MSNRSGEGGVAEDDFPAPEILRMLVCVASRGESADLVGYLGTLATARTVVAREVHVIEHTALAGVIFEPAADAAELVEDAVFALWMAGVGADGAVRHGTPRRIGQIIVDEAISWRADTIVLSGQRTRGWRRVLGAGVREDVLRRSSTPVALVSAQRPAAQPRRDPSAGARRSAMPPDMAPHDFVGPSHSPWTNRRLDR